MPQFPPAQPSNGDPTPAEIYRVFRNTTMASIEGLRLLLDECADLRAELVIVHGLHGNGDGDGVFSARQQSHILELQDAAKSMAALVASLTREPADGADGSDAWRGGT